jgi:hypothetical protein
LTFANAQSLVEEGEDEDPEDQEKEVGADVDKDMSYEFYKVLE